MPRPHSHMSDPQFPASGLCAYITYRDLDWPSSGSDHPEPAFFFPLHRQIYAQTTILPSSSSFPFLVFSSLSLSLFSTYIYTLSLSHSTVLPHYPTDRRHPSPLGHFGRGLGLLVQFRVRHHGGFIITSTGGRMVSLVLSPQWQLTEMKC